MRIINATTNPRYFSYASNAGRTLQPGGQSNELPFEVALNPTLWKDLDAGNVTLVLSQDDKSFIGRLLQADSKTPVQTAQQAEPLSTREKNKAKATAARVANEARVKTAEVLKSALKTVKINGGGGTGQPDFSAPDRSGAIPVVVPGKAQSLAQLQQHNKGVAKRPAGVKMNEPGSVPGQPAFSPGPGPGTENAGAGKPLPATQERLKKGFGSMV
jgi:hypothetical protein